MANIAGDNSIVTEEGVLDSSVIVTPTVTTDLADYQPGSTAIITASNFIVGSTISFQVSHVLDSGSDGQYGTLDDVTDATANASGATPLGRQSDEGFTQRAHSFIKQSRAGNAHLKNLGKNIL